MTLDEVEKAGDLQYKVLKSGGRLLDLGVIPGVTLSVLKTGDPVEIDLGYALSLSKKEAEAITLEPCKASPRNIEDSEDIDHPKIGEGGERGKFQKPLRIALVGNPNTGKTTLFNTLTGGHSHVGNFPGVTVESREGAVKGSLKQKITLVDLPGTYTLKAASADEKVARDFLLYSPLDKSYDCIIDIVDANNIERNLYLTLQLLELGRPVVVALNLVEELNASGGSVLINSLEEALKTPVVAVNAKRGDGVEELLEHCLSRQLPGAQDYCSASDPSRDPKGHAGAVHRAIHAVTHLIADHAEAIGLPPKFVAEGLLNKEDFPSLKLDQNEMDTIEHIACQMEAESGLERDAAIADMRYRHIRGVCSKCVHKPKKSKKRAEAQALDRVLMGPFGILIFLAIMGLIFFLTFSLIGPVLQYPLVVGFERLTAFLDSILGSRVPFILRSCLLDGVMTGLSSVVSFLPIILTLFFFLSILEDSGYMARVAFIMDKAMRFLGLSGRSIVPLLLGFGCTVSAVMAIRTLPSSRDRKLTLFLLPFASCGAKLPLYAFFCQAFFPRYAALVMTLLYILGIVLGVVLALILKALKFHGGSTFVLELPNYRMPGGKSVVILLWEKARDFLKRASSVIVLSSVIIWVLETFDFHLSITSSPDESLLAKLSGLIAPLFWPLGFDWRAISSLITGFLAKEAVVSTMTVLYGSIPVLVAAIPFVEGVSLLVFCALYTPCIAAISVIKKEAGMRWALGIALFMCIVAYLAALLTHLIVAAVV